MEVKAAVWQQWNFKGGSGELPLVSANRKREENKELKEKKQSFKQKKKKKQSRRKKKRTRAETGCIFQGRDSYKARLSGSIKEFFCYFCK